MCSSLTAAPENVLHLHLNIWQYEFERLNTQKFYYLPIFGCWKWFCNQNLLICLTLRDTCDRQKKWHSQPCPHLWFSKPFMMCKFSFVIWGFMKNNFSPTAPFDNMVHTENKLNSPGKHEMIAKTSLLDPCHSNLILEVGLMYLVRRISCLIKNLGYCL